MSPEVRVVCAWYQRAAWVDETVRSVLDQRGVDLEVVVVDDGSPDPDVRRHLRSIEDPRLRVVHQENAGFTAAIRRAIEGAQTPFLAVQGAGDVSALERLERQLAVMRDRPDVVACGTGHRNVVPGSGRPGQYGSPDARASERSLMRSMPFTHGSAVYRTEAFERAGGYDARMKYCADWDLFFRLVRQGPIVGLDEALYERRIFSDGFTFSPDTKFRQLLFRDVARERDPVGHEAMIEEALAAVAELDPTDRRFLPETVRYLLGALRRGDGVNARAWLSLLGRQIVGGR